MDVTDFLLLLSVFFKLAMQTTSAKEEDSGCVDGMSCMSLAECSAQLRSWQQNESDILFRCNYGKQKVCCPLSPRTREKSNMDLLPNEKCGLTSASKISSGHNATFGQFPWMALLGSRLSNGGLRFICGGTLISDQYILTAAHCLHIVNATLEIIRLGEHNLDTVEDCEDYCSDPVQDYQVEMAVSHKEFDIHNLKNDIALIRLHTKVPQYTDYIRPICLPFGINITGEEETKYQIAGWGKTDFYEPKGSAVLQFATVNSVPLEDCNSRQAAEVRPLGDTQLCAAGNSGEDACKGDSGGPLMDVVQLPTRRTAQIFQVGLVSFGSIPCGAQTTPSVYTRVS
ncbi:hypothetical protein B7P43_G07142, partial [Cryptotermes secundus]